MSHVIPVVERTKRPWHKLEACPGSNKGYKGNPKMTGKYNAVSRWTGKCAVCGRWTMADPAREIVTFHMRKN